MKTPGGLERLYAVPLREFTRARNALAAELRRAGANDRARAVARLRRPSAPLWAVNQLARSARPALERLLDAVERLRRTQLSDPRGAMDAMRKEREQLDALVARAGDALSQAGFRPSAATTRRISAMLLGAAADPRHATELRAGRLTEEPPAPGFEALSGTPRDRHLRLVSGGGARGDEVRRTRDDERQRADQARRDQRERERAQKADVRARAAEERKRQAEERRREAQQRAAEVSMLERDAAAARQRLAEIDQRLSMARRRARTPRPRAGA